MIPQVTSLSPEEGAAGGGELVHVVGAGFADQVLVEFGGQAAELARAWTIGGVSYADVRVPPRSAGLVDVVLRNVDAGGDPVPGESVTVTDGFRFRAAQLARRSGESDTGDAGLTEVMQALVVSMRRALLANTGTPVAVDYDETTVDGLSFVYHARLPSVVIHGLRVVQARNDSANVLREEAAGGDVLRRRQPIFVDLELQLTGAADGLAPTLNLVAAAASYFERTPWLEVPVAGEDPVLFEMDVQDDTRVSLRSPAEGKGGNVKAFSLSFVVRGVGLSDAVPFDRTHAVDETVLEFEAIPRGA